MVIEYANHLATEGNEVSFYSAVFETVFELHPHISLVQLPCRHELTFMVYCVTQKFTDDLIIVDIIHLPLLVSFRNKVVYFAQADDVEYYSNFVARIMIGMFYRAYLCNKASVITVDDRLTNAFRERYHFHTSHTVTNGINLDMFYPDPDKELIASKGANKAVIFMSRGDHYRKGFDVAMDVFRRISDEPKTRMELWVCGTVLEQKPFTFKVRNFGVVSDTQLRKILSSADMFFYPSRHEGFGLFPLEAMACGCVVVTTEAIPYASRLDCILTNRIGDVNGLLGSLKKLMNDDELLHTLQSKVVRTAQFYDLRKSKEAFLNALASVLKEQTGCA